MDDEHKELLEESWETLNRLIGHENMPEFPNDELAFAIIMFHDVVGQFLEKIPSVLDHPSRLIGFIHARNRFIETMNSWTRKIGGNNAGADSEPS